MIGKGTAEAVKKVTTRKKVAVWACGNCGHEVPITDDLEGLLFEQYSDRTSRVICPGCGSYTIQKAYDGSFRAGNFLLVKSKLKTWR